MDKGLYPISEEFFNEKINPLMLKRGLQTKGKNVSGMTTKFHLAITADGHLAKGLLTGGNVQDVAVANELTKDVVGCSVLEDMGYDSDEHREHLRSNNNIPVIPERKNRKIPIT